MIMVNTANPDVAIDIKSDFPVIQKQILEDDNQYTDRKGREYYIDYVLNQSSIRQWSLSELADYGFDKNTGIWAECPGYSCGVVADYADFVNLFDRNLNMDLTKHIPVIPKAIAATPQYLFL